MLLNACGTTSVLRTFDVSTTSPISYQVGFGPCAVQVLQLFQPLYLLIMILQNTSHQVHSICSYPKVNLYFIMRTLLLCKCFTQAMGRDLRRLISSATSILIADHHDSHCDCCHKDDMTLMQLCTCSSGGLSVGHPDV